MSNDASQSILSGENNLEFPNHPANTDKDYFTFGQPDTLASVPGRSFDIVGSEQQLQALSEANSRTKYGLEAAVNENFSPITATRRYETTLCDSISNSFCDYCQSMLDDLSRGLDDTDYVFPHHQTYQKLEMSATDGCSLCAQFVRGRPIRPIEDGSRKRIDVKSEYVQSTGIKIGHQSNDRSDFDRDARERYLTRTILRHMFQVEPAAHVDNRGQRFELQVKLIPPSSTQQQLETFGVVNTKRQKTQHHGSSFPAGAFYVASSWLATCRQSHGRCNSRREKFVPTRLVSTIKGDIRLCSAEDFPEPPTYATLSHCWGHTKFITLESRNIEVFMKGIPAEALAPNLLDAINIAQELGLMYIWIDSLCILQDDFDDWEREAALMSSVYQGSSLNIAATSATDGNSNCFAGRSPYRRCEIEIRRKDHIDRFDCVPKDMYTDAVSLMPLNRRAWVLQERLLAPRTLHLSSMELFWECYQQSACETFPKSLPDCFTDNAFFLSKRPVSKSMWHWIITQYTLCDLTYTKDKLVAISGLARAIQAQTGDQYIAGMWRENLELQLCWSTYMYDRVQKVIPYRAPSWSWASHDCSITNSITGIFESVEENATLCATILDVNLQYLGRDLFGQLTMAELVLSCKYLANATFQVSYEGGRPGYMFVGEEKFEYGFWWFDGLVYGDFADRNVANNFQQIMVLPIFEFYDMEQHNNIHGLLLEPTGQKRSEYRRVGYFMVESEEASMLKNACVRSWPDRDERAEIIITMV